jgi:hypothetical protein
MATLTLEQAIERLPTDPQLVYIDYTDSFEDNDDIQTIIREHLMNNDKSDPMKDIIKNTRDTLVLYDL